MRSSLALPAAVLFGAAPGCASGSSGARVSALEQEVAALRRERQADEKRLAALEDQVDAQQAQIARLRGRPGSAAGEPTGLPLVHLRPEASPAHAPRLPTTIPVRLPDDDALAQLAQAAQAGAPGASDGAGPEAAFASAFEKLKVGDLDGAAAAFQTFAARWPKNSAADNALLDEGIALYGQHAFADALAVFASVERRYPAGDAVPEALWRAADCEERLGRSQDARRRLAHLAAAYPATAEGARAREKLAANEAVSRKEE